MRMSDLHGVSVAPLTAVSKDRLIVLSIGGSNGRNPKFPRFLLATPKKQITEVFRNELKSQTQAAFKSRGRISIFMDLSLDSIPDRIARKGGPDILIASFLGLDSDKIIGEFPFQYAFRNTNGTLKAERVPGFEDERQGRAEVTDIDGDGTMEIISYQNFTIYKLIAPFTFKDITADVMPNIDIRLYSVNAVVELDYDNDGDMDLYLARGFEKLASNRFGRPKITEYTDILLENRNGVYFDVSEGANIVGLSESASVSAADFNNDGWIDLIVTQRIGPDIMLINRGDGTFDQVDAMIAKDENTRSDNTVAVDLNADGLVDMVAAQGLRSEVTGKYMVLRNVTPRTEKTNFVLVNVGSVKSGSCTALHAVVTVQAGGLKIIRRVAGVGSQKAGPGSFIDTVHFGLGDATMIDEIRVRWITGETKVRRRVTVNRKYRFGLF